MSYISHMMSLSSRLPMEILGNFPSGRTQELSKLMVRNLWTLIGIGHHSYTPVWLASRCPISDIIQ